MLVELSVVEQRYHAVMEVLSAGAPMVEAAERYGVSRKSGYQRQREAVECGAVQLTVQVPKVERCLGCRPGVLPRRQCPGSTTPHE